MCRVCIFSPETRSPTHQSRNELVSFRSLGRGLSRELSLARLGLRSCRAILSIFSSRFWREFTHPPSFLRRLRSWEGKAAPFIASCCMIGIAFCQIKSMAVQYAQRAERAVSHPPLSLYRKGGSWVTHGRSSDSRHIVNHSNQLSWTLNFDTGLHNFDSPLHHHGTF